MYKTMKIYYDNVTGELLWSASYGYPVTPNFDRDYEAVIDLKSRVKESIGLLVLTDGQYAQDFEDGRLIGVNPETKIPIFEYPNPDDPDEPIVQDRPFSEQILEIKKQQFVTNNLLSEINITQQELIELLMEMG